MSQYVEGTVTTDGTNTIVGVGTLWVANVTAGTDSFLIPVDNGGDGVVYDVVTVTDDTHIVLSGAYGGDNVSGVGYAIARDFTSNQNIPELGRRDVGSDGIFTRAMRKIDSVLANFTAAVLGIAGGGTGASTAPAARTNLGAAFSSDPNNDLPIADGGTGSGTASGARTNLSVPAISDTAIQAQTTHNMASDADYTLTTSQAQKAIIKITDTGVLLTTGRNIIVPDAARVWIVDNQTAQISTFKTSAGTGVPVAAGVKATVYSDGTNVLTEEPTWTDYTPTIAASGGAITTITQNVFRWRRSGEDIEVFGDFTIDNNGTGSGVISVTFPIVSASSDTFVGMGVGRDAGVTGDIVSIEARSTTDDFTLRFGDGSYPGSTGARIPFSCSYKVTA
jgi:hypothetical protein